jgi:hypothetical protein
MHMKRTKGRRPQDWVDPNGGKKALERLSPVLSILYALIEEGVTDSLLFFEERGKPIHNVVFASLVRLKLWEHVESRTGAADLQCKVVYKGNIGVRVIYNGSTIAVWKADKDGNLPPCGESGQRQNFYTQTLIPEMYGSDALPTKLALLWDRNKSGVLTLRLVAPKGYNSFWKSGLIHWDIDVPHPAKTIAATTDVTSGAEEMDDLLKHKKTADEPRHSKG